MLVRASSAIARRWPIGSGVLAFLLRPVHERLWMTLKTSPKLFADETTAPVLDPGQGRTKLGQLWAYAPKGEDATHGKDAGQRQDEGIPGKQPSFSLSPPNILGETCFDCFLPSRQIAGFCHRLLVQMRD